MVEEQPLFRTDNISYPCCHLSLDRVGGLEEFCVSLCLFGGTSPHASCLPPFQSPCPRASTPHGEAVFCAGAHYTDGNGWLPTENLPAAKCLAPAAMPQPSTRAWGFGSAVKEWGRRPPCSACLMGRLYPPHPVRHTAACRCGRARGAGTEGLEEPPRSQCSVVLVQLSGGWQLYLVLK